MRMCNFADQPFILECIDGAAGMTAVPEHSVKLVYGSPPYPNATRDYGIWPVSEYIDRITPFIDASLHCLRHDGFLVINIKANREKATQHKSSHRSLIVERLAILLEERWHLHCVDIEMWFKENPVPTGLRVACQDAYEQNLWFSVSPIWSINIDAIRRPYVAHSVDLYGEYEYKPRGNGLSYVRKAKRIECNPLGALPINVIRGGVAAQKTLHQASQPIYLPRKYVLATTEPGDIVLDPWMGSGTTGEASVSLGRRFIGFDISEEYIEVSHNRIEQTLRGDR